MEHPLRTMLVVHCNVAKYKLELHEGLNYCILEKADLGKVDHAQAASVMNSAVTNVPSKSNQESQITCSAIVLVLRKASLQIFNVVIRTTASCACWRLN
eukprot:2020672-Amphidinium_carterae.1